MTDHEGGFRWRVRLEGLWGRIEPKLLALTGILVLCAGLTAVQYSATHDTLPWSFRLIFAAAGGAVAFAGILTGLRLRRDLVDLILRGTTAATFAIVLAVINSDTQADWSVFVLPVGLAALTLLVETFGRPFQRQT